jgi:SAM-dependent methyltransferase
MASFQPKFGHAAEEFQRYRPDYPAPLYNHIFAQVPEQSRGRAMDLGAGTGRVTAHLLPHFREVISVEPDQGMAAKIVERFPQAVVREVTVEDCVQPAESADLITIANALHWMEADRVFANTRLWLRPAGILAVFGPSLPKTTGAIDAITLAEFRGPWKPHRDPRLKRDLIWQDQVRAALGFQVIEETKFTHIIPMSPSDYVGFWRSTSYGSAYARTLDDPENYWNSLESRFAAAAAGDMIPVDYSPTLILARKL